VLVSRQPPSDRHLPTVHHALNPFGDNGASYRPSRQRTRSCWSTTAISSSPILQEPTGW